MRKKSTTSRQSSKPVVTHPVKASSLRKTEKSFYEVTFCKRNIILMGMLLLGGWLHTLHIRRMFEEDGRFSYLSRLERELKFRTELGFYYSYFKEIIEAPSFLSGIVSILRDDISEYPDVINALRRFNLYPEVITGAAYRIYKQTWDAMNWKTMDCYTVNRGDPMPPVESCEGLGEPAFFYVTSVLLCNGLSPIGLGLMAYWLAGKSRWAAFLAQLAFFANHSECTRVQWHPGLRENFAYPFFVIQQACLVFIVQKYAPPSLSTRSQTPTSAQKPQLSWLEASLLTWLTLCFLIPWQFAQFPLFLQTLILFVVGPIFHLIPHIIFCQITLCLWMAVLANVLLQMANSMLLTAFCLASLTALLLIYWIVPKLGAYGRTLMFSRLPQFHCRRPFLSSIIQTFVFLMSTFVIKIVLNKLFSSGEEDHVWQILRSKFTDYRAFHTLIYTCSAEFDFYGISSLISLTKTLLFPTACLCFIGGVVYTLVILERHWFSHVSSGQSTRSEKAMKEVVTANGDQASPATEIVDDNDEIFCYPLNVSPTLLIMLAQTLFFTILAMLIMRLKLFFTPQLCIMSSLIAHPQLWSCMIRWCHRIKLSSSGITLIKEEDMDSEMQLDKVNYRHICLIVLCAAIMFQGSANLRHELTIGGEFSNWPMEQLIYWIRENTVAPHEATPTKPAAVFSGSMPTMATVRLSTRRYIILHPHYEDAGLRDRVYRSYRMFSRRPARVVWEDLRMGLNVTHFIFEVSWCYSANKPKCRFADMYDLEDGEQRSGTPLCEILDSNPATVMPYFSLIYRNENFKVFKLMDAPK